MLSGHNSPSLHPHSHRAHTAIKRPSSRDSSSGYSTPLMGQDGELHDPSYNESWQHLKASIEASSTASPMAKRSTINAMRRRSILEEGAPSSSEDEEELDSPHPSRRQATAPFARQAYVTAPSSQRPSTSRPPSRPTSAGSGSSRKSPSLSWQRGGSLRGFSSSNSKAASPAVNPLDDWGSSFTGLVDVQREQRSRRNSAEASGDAAWISRPSSPASSAASGSRSRQTRRSSDQHGDAAATAVAQQGSSRRRSSESSVRQNGPRRLANFAQETLKKARSESDPAPLQHGVEDVDGHAAPGYQAAGNNTHRLSPILSTSYEADHRRRSIGRARGAAGGTETPLTPLDEDNAYYHRDLAAAASALYGGNDRGEYIEAPEQRTERERSHRLPMLGPRPAPIHQEIGGNHDDSDSAVAAGKPSSTAAAAAGAGSGPDLEALRRKMQNIGLGVKFKTMRIKKKWAESTASVGQNGRRRSGSESS